MKILQQREKLLYSWLLAILLLYYFTEIASFFNVINQFTSTLILFGSIAIAISTVRYLKNPHEPVEQQKLSFISILNALFILFTLACTLLIAIRSAPNNWDSMTYHLGRIMHWKQNGNIEFYPTHITRQLYNPPLSEYIMLHLFTAFNHDIFLNLVHWISYLICIVLVSLITKELRFNFENQIMAALLASTIPMVILQSTNTKNDLTLAAFVLSTAYFMLHYYNHKKPYHIIFIGISIALAAITKGTAYIYLFPMVAVFGIWFLFSLNRNNVFYLFLAVATFIIVIFPVYARNMAGYNHIFGGLESERNYYRVSSIEPLLIVSNVLKNLYIHVSNVYLWNDPEIFSRIGDFSFKILINIHHYLGIDPLDSRTTWGYTDLHYTLRRDEDYAGNFLHILLTIAGFIFTLFLFFQKKINLVRFIYALVVVMVFFLFCSLLKWQPWHSRLHSVIFLLAIPIILNAMDQKLKFIPLVTTCLLSAGSIFYLLGNETRSLISTEKTITGHSTSIFQMFRDEIMMYKKGNHVLDELKAIEKIVREKKIKSLGIIIDEDGWDYPVYKLLQRKNPTLKIYHTEVNFAGLPTIPTKNMHNMNFSTILVLKKISNPRILEESIAYTILFNGQEYLLYQKN